MTSPTFTQVAFRSRNDDGSETGATWRQAQDTNDYVPKAQNFRLRFIIDEGNSALWSTTPWNLYVARNGGLYGVVPTSGGTYVQLSASSQFANGDDCTQQLTFGGSGTFLTNNNGMTESAWNSNAGAKNQFFEIEFCLQFQSSAAIGDYYDFRVYRNGTAIGTYTVTPRITVCAELTGVADAYSTDAVEDPGKLTQTHVLTVNDAYCIDEVDTTVVTIPSITLTVNDAYSVCKVDHVWKGTIANEGFESGDLTGWTETDPDGDLNVTTDARLASTGYGAEFNIDDTAAFYILKNYGTYPDYHRLRFYIDRNTLSLSSGQYMILFKTQDRTSYVNIVIFSVRNTAGTYALEVTLQNDAGATAFSDSCTLSSGPHYVEFYLKAATNASINDAEFEWWFDGASQGSGSGLQVYATMTKNIRIVAGCFSTIPLASSGVYYIDEIVMNDNGSWIGPVVQIDVVNDSYVEDYVDTTVLDVEGGGIDLVVADAYCDNVVDTVATTKETALTGVADAFSTCQTDAVVLTKETTLTGVADAFSTCQTDAVVLTKQSTLTGVADAYCVDVIDTVVTTKESALTGVADTYCEDYVDTVVVEIPTGDTLVVADAYCSNVVDTCNVLELRPNGARLFNGSTDRIDFSNKANLKTTPYTISVWLRLYAYKNGYWLCTHDSGDTNYGVLISGGAAGNIINVVHNAATYYNWYSGSATGPALNTWAHILVTNDGNRTGTSNMKFWLNGNSVTVTGFTGSGTETEHTGSWSVGARKFDDTRNMDGMIGEVAVWSRELSEAERNILFAHEKSADQIDDGLIFVFHPDEPKDLETGETGTTDGTTLDYGPALDFASRLTVSDAYSLDVVDAVTTTKETALTGVADAYCIDVVDATTVELGSVTLVVADAYCINGVDDPGKLTQVHVISTVSDAYCIDTVETFAITVGGISLVVADAYCIDTVEVTGKLVQVHVISVLDAYCVDTVETLTTTKNSAITGVADAYCVDVVDTFAITKTSAITGVADAYCVDVVDVTGKLTQAHNIASVSDTYCIDTVETVITTVTYVLAVLDAYSEDYVDEVDMRDYASVITPKDRTYFIIEEIRTYTIDKEDRGLSVILEDRTYEIIDEKRTLSVLAEVRTEEV